MKPYRWPPARSRGFSLIEVLIAVVLGLVILIAVTNIFISSRQTFRTQEGLSQVQETGRLLNYLMYPYIRLAGYVGDPIKQTDPAALYTNRSANPDNTAVRGLDDVTASNIFSAVVGTDVISVRYRGQDALGTPGTADGSITNCGGLGGAAGVSSSQVAENVFYVRRRSGETVSSLTCRATVFASDGTTVAVSTQTQPILQGVEDLQILYGVGAPSTLTGDRVTQRYYTAAAMPAADWNRVTSVRVTLTVDSIDRVAGNATVAGGSNEGRLRRTFTSTLQIRNRLN